MNVPLLFGSAADGSVAVIVTVGLATSLSVMFTVALFGVPMVYAAFVEIVSLTVSVLSTIVSSITLTEMVLVVCPDSMVMYPGKEV